MTIDNHDISRLIIIVNHQSGYVSAKTLQTFIDLLTPILSFGRPLSVPFSFHLISNDAWHKEEGERERERKREEEVITLSAVRLFFCTGVTAESYDRYHFLPCPLPSSSPLKQPAT